MIIRELERGGGVIVKAMLARQAESDRLRGRCAGLHLTAILDDMMTALFGPRKREIQDKTRAALYEIGDIIEQIIAEELLKRLGWSKPKPKKVNGIWCSPDGYSVRTKTIDEVKSTHMSCRKIVQRPDGRIEGFEEDPRLLKYLMQLKSYMHCWKAVRGRLHVVFLNGDYRPPFPDPRTFIVRPETDGELADTWMTVVGHAKDKGWL